MKTAFAMLACVGVALLLCASASAYTLTFDDIAAGSGLTYYSDQFGATFSDGFQVADHANSAWGPAHSTPNVLVWTAGSGDECELRFGNGSWAHPGTIPPYSISSLSACFGTDQHVLVNMVGYRNDPVYGTILVGTRMIGDEWECWDNVSIELRAEDGGVIDYVVFEGVASSAARLGFCADDMTIEPVPEPSTLSFLSLALAGIGVGRLRRRRAV